MLEASIEAAASAIIDLKGEFNDWDSTSGDGDCGATLSRPVMLLLIFCSV